MKKHFTDIDLNRSVGNLLRIGVILSVTTAIIGFIKLFFEGFKMPKHYEDLGNKTGNILQEFWVSLMKLEGMSIIQLGILFLILTPLMRILFALIGYLKEKDYVYVVISLIIIGIMAISFLMGFA
jgi:uncharacterized membrane protein